MAAERSAVAEPAEIDVIVEADGSLQVSASRLAAHGLRPGDRLRLVPEPRRRRQSMLGAGARDLGFADSDLAELRRDMAAGLGDDLTR